MPHNWKPSSGSGSRTVWSAAQNALEVQVLSISLLCLFRCQLHFKSSFPPGPKVCAAVLDITSNNVLDLFLKHKKTLNSPIPNTGLLGLVYSGGVMSSFLNQWLLGDLGHCPTELAWTHISGGQWKMGIQPWRPPPSLLWGEKLYIKRFKYQQPKT